MNRSLELQRLTLSLLADRSVDHRLGRGEHYFSEAIRARLQPSPSRAEVQQAFWSLVAQGLAYIDMWQPAAENWELVLTPAGAAALTDEDYNPDDPSGYLERLARDIPSLSATTAAYLRESLRAYAGGLYLSATVMLGVASEAAVLDMAEKLATFANSQALRDTLDNPRVAYNKKFQETRKVLDAQRARLPATLAEGMSLTFDSVLDLLRTNRNDAGHPTGRSFDRDDCFVALRMSVKYLKRVYEIRDFLASSP